MQAMRLSRALPLLTLSPTILQCSACRSSPLLTQLDLHRPQSFPATAMSNFNSNPPKRFSTSVYLRSSKPPASPLSFIYRIGASFSAKGKKFNPKEDIYTFNATKSTDVYTGRPAAGQDAFFVSTLGSPPSSSGNDVAFGVADGVGGWADSGIDSADFSHGLCNAMVQIAHEDGDGRGKRRAGKEGKKMGPRELLDKAYTSVVEANEIEGGGSTACVAIGREDGNITVANLGDSGFVQLRPSAVHYYSNPQTHAFNTPYQLSIVPPKVLQMSKAFGGSPLSDMPSAADVSTHAVRHGDVLVFATDGVWDNLSSADLLKVVNKRMIGWGAWVGGEGQDSDVGKGLEMLTRDDGLRIGTSAAATLQTHLAVAVVAEAKAASVDQRKDGPFAREVQKHYPGEDWHGGKVDDICVVVAVVVEEGKTDDNIGKPKL